MCGVMGHTCAGSWVICEWGHGSHVCKVRGHTCAGSGVRHERGHGSHVCGVGGHTCVGSWVIRVRGRGARVGQVDEGWGCVGGGLDVVYTCRRHGVVTRMS